MNESEITELLKSTGVIMEGHYLLTSGRHSARFLQCSQLMQYPEHAAGVCRGMAEPFLGNGVETVIGPAMGGVILSYEIARVLGARAVFAEPSGGGMALRRGFKVKPAERVLVAEDAISTGGSVKKVLDLLQPLDVEIAGVTVMIDRTAGKVDLGVPFRALLEMEIESFEPQNCPLCREGIPLQRPKG